MKNRSTAGVGGKRRVWPIAVKTHSNVGAHTECLIKKITTIKGIFRPVLNGRVEVLLQFLAYIHVLYNSPVSTLTNEAGSRRPLA